MFGRRILSLITVTSACALLVSGVGECGNGVKCAAGLCCSKFGFCGSTSDYCGSGCQQEFSGANAQCKQTQFFPLKPLPKGKPPSKVFTNCNKNLPNALALTFDDGPYQWMGKIVDMLHAHDPHARVTFFVNGNNWDCIYQDDVVSNLTYAFKHGHQIAMHSWSHPHMSKLNETQTRYQIEYLQNALQRILGVVPRYFRFPYGDYNKQNLKTLGAYNLKVVQWSDDSGDSDDSISLSHQKSNYVKFLSTSGPHVILNHEVKANTVEQLIPYALHLLKTKYKRFKLVSAAECVNGKINENHHDWYKSMTTPGKKNEDWTCDNSPAPGQFP